MKEKEKLEVLNYIKYQRIHIDNRTKTLIISGFTDKQWEKVKEYLLNHDS